jgi:hypothetical protein
MRAFDEWERYPFGHRKFSPELTTCVPGRPFSAEGASKLYEFIILQQVSVLCERKSKFRMTSASGAMRSVSSAIRRKPGAQNAFRNVCTFCRCRKISSGGAGLCGFFSAIFDLNSVPLAIKGYASKKARFRAWSIQGKQSPTGGELVPGV